MGASEPTTALALSGWGPRAGELLDLWNGDANVKQLSQSPK